jgi:hypothetical protein
MTADAAPSRREVLLLTAAVFAIHAATVASVTSLRNVVLLAFDNPTYLEIAAIIRHGPGPRIIEGGFWGLPYAIAGASVLLRIPDAAALVLISLLSSLAASALVHRLYGGWVAMVFVLLNHQWIQLSVQGGTEPLFVCLLYAAFLAARSDRWSIGALLAALATTVRPFGVLALVSFAAALAARRDYKRLAAVTAIGLAVGAAYVVPLRMMTGSVLFNVAGYQRDWGAGGTGWPVTFPFGAVIPSYARAIGELKWFMASFDVAWLAGGCVASAAVWLPRNRDWSSAHLAEALFATAYALFLFSYNYPEIAVFVPRFLIPVTPVLAFAVRDWIPRDRRLLWELAILSAVVATIFTPR